MAQTVFDMKATDLITEHDQKELDEFFQTLRSPDWVVSSSSKDGLIISWMKNDKSDVLLVKGIPPPDRHCQYPQPPRPCANPPPPPCGQLPRRPKKHSIAVLCGDVKAIFGADLVRAAVRHGETMFFDL